MNFYITPDRAPTPNGCYLFEKKAEIKKEGLAEINIFAASRYILYVNGEYVCEGPCRSNERLRYYDSIRTFLKRGTNHIAVKVMHVTDFFTSVHKTPLPQLVFEAKAGDEIISSDGSWSIKYLNAYTYKTYFMTTVPPYEWVDRNAGITELKCVETGECIFEEKGSFNRVGASSVYVLEKRPIPMIYPGKEFEIKPIKQGEGFAEYDAGEYMTAKLKFDILKNSDVKIIYSECYEFENGKRRRDDTSGELKGYYDVIKTADEDFLFEPFWFRAFRFIRIEGNVSAVRHVKAARINYPFDIEGSFKCSDESFNKMHEVSINSVRCCAHEIIVDCPYYEQQQYEMDSLVQLAIISRMTSDRRLHRKCIEEFALSQFTNGLLTSIAPSTVIQIIPGFSFMWIMMLHDYLENTADTDYVASYVGNMDRILTYFDKIVSEKGFISKSIYWDFTDWVPEWNYGDVPLKDGEVHTIYNLYYAKALSDGVDICRRLGRLGLAGEYSARHKKLSDTLNRLCFDNERGLYTDGSETKTYSMHTIVWAILSDVAPIEMQKTLVEHICDEGISKCTFAMNFFTFRALEKCGRQEKAFEFFDGWKKMLDLGCTTWCENPDSPRSECHGWSSAPLYEFSSNILGVRIHFEDEIIIEPHTAHLTHAGGTVPTRFGTVSVSWKNENGKFDISICSPDNVKKKLILPNGKKYEFTCNKYTVSI